MKNHITITSSILILLAGCGGGGMDIHDVDRDAKPYESVQVDQLDTDALLTHLLGLADEMTAATTESAYIEMHHLEIALTKALVALEAKLPDGATSSTINTLKILAVRIHEAGHDQNGAMAQKLEKTLREKLLQLQAEQS